MNTGTDTKTRILDTAERLFAQHGIDATSLRAITKAAGVNIAAVNYHFQSKDELVRAVLSRRVAPINQKRMEMLDQAEAEAGTGRLSLERVLEAFLAPVLRAGYDRNDELAAFRPLLGRFHTEPAEFVQRTFRDQMGPVAERFLAALQRALPGLTREEVVWRVFFMVGAMCHVMAGGALLEAVSAGACKASDVDGAVSRLISFAAAGFRAPVDVREPASR